MPAIRIEATYSVVTPLFCAGADSKTPEVRLPSFKGVLRYWWRALAWSRYGADLGVLRQQEDRLFGSAGGGQSRVVMRLASAPQSPKISVGDVLEARAGAGVVGEGARYLGYGVMEAFGSRKKGTKAGQLTRACLGAPFDFTVQMRARHLDGQESTSLVNALVAVGILGGLGARSRKGYGSLALQSLHVNGEARWSTPRSMDELQRAIAALRSGQTHDHAGAYPEFTALSNRARHVLLSSTRREPLELLDLVGREMVRFRSWGRKGRIFESQLDSEKKFQDDHDLMKGRQRRSHPRRIAFGLPHNYGQQKVGPADGLDRRASPLFIHIHPCDDEPVAVLSFLPARFLPAGKSDISVGGSRVPQAPEEELYGPVREFLARLLDRDRRREPFTDAVEVRS
jgi:CRISPR-associated protein Cmr1